MAFFEITGKVVTVGELQAFASGFTKRTLVVDVTQNANYPAPVPFDFKKDHTHDIERVRAGDEVKVKFCIGGREFDGGNGKKYFVDLTGFDCTVTRAAAVDMNAVIEDYKATHGGEFDKDDFISICKATIDKNKPSKTYTADDWAKVRAAILNTVEADTDSAADDSANDPEDFPF